MALTHSTVGFVHLIAAGLALAAGTVVMFLPKGGAIHHRLGYVYVLAMTVMLVTAFQIYALFGTFGVFHWLAVVSSVTLAGGMLPLFLRRPTHSYLLYHLSFMYWSVVGLYMAFFGEMAARLPALLNVSGDRTTTLLGAVIISGVIFGIAAQVVWRRKKKEWSARYGTVVTG